MKAPVLTSDRLVLEPLSSAFLSEEYLNWLNDLEVSRYLESSGGYELDDLKDYLVKVDKQHILFWAIIDKATSKHIGNIKIDPINQRHGTAEYGILIGDKNSWGKGLAHEASELVIAYCFETRRLRKISLGVVEENTPAIKLYEKLGFGLEGVYKEHGFYDNKWCNVLRMALFNPTRR